MKKVKIAQFGLGGVGFESLRYAAGLPWVEIVGAVDHDPQKNGRSLVELTGLGSLDGLSLCPTLEDLFRETQPDVILHTAASKATTAFEQIRPALELGLTVASTAEELIYPALLSPVVARELDILCRYAKARVVATGVNPGFVMDLLPLCLTGVCREMHSIRVGRVVDAATRRQTLQAKIGCGQEVAVFRQKLQSKLAGLAGIRESAALLGHALGWRLDEITESREPVVAAENVSTDFFSVHAGQNCGIHQRVIGLMGGEEKIVLELRVHLGAADPRDTILIKGQPDLNVVVNGGVPGEDATVAALLNVVPRLLAASPGFHLLHELTTPLWTGGSAPL